MEKFTEAPDIGAVAGSVTLKTTVEVVIWPEPCTPIAPGVADMNWIPPAAPGGGGVPPPGGGGGVTPPPTPPPPATPATAKHPATT
jgi:hypothetical protein